MDLLSHRLSALSIVEGDLCIVVGLANAPQYNNRAARVLPQTPDAASGNNRIPVVLLHGSHKKFLSVRRQNLLRATHREDREALLTRVVLQHQQELRVVRFFLEEKLHGEEGLLLHIASFFPPRETMALTTGFAMGRIIPSWCCAVLNPRGGGLSWRPLHQGGDGWDGVPVDDPDAKVGALDTRSVPDGIVRIDCAVVAIDQGRFLVAGGCADHPSRARAFFKSAFLYDSLVHVATPLPDMPCRRHGCGGAYLDGKVYILGGNYVERDHALISVLNLATREWTALSPAMDAQLASEDAAPIAFVPVGGIDGRLVMLVEGHALAFNPQRPEQGWCVCIPEAAANPAARDEMRTVDLGTSACASVCWGHHLIVSAGRNADSYACHVGAFSFLYPASSSQWMMGCWADLGAAGPTGRVGAGLAVVHDRLYISGGVDESPGGGFDGTVAVWGGRYTDLANLECPQDSTNANHRRDCKRPWRVVEGLELPTAMHAHEAIAIPWLPSSRP